MRGGTLDTLSSKLRQLIEPVFEERRQALARKSKGRCPESMVRIEAGQFFMAPRTTTAAR